MLADFMAVTEGETSVRWQQQRIPEASQPMSRKEQVDFCNAADCTRTHVILYACVYIQILCIIYIYICIYIYAYLSIYKHVRVCVSKQYPAKERIREPTKTKFLERAWSMGPNSRV